MKMTRLLLTNAFAFLMVATALHAGENFEGKDLKEIDYTGKNLSGANFRDSIIDQCRFDSATLVEADFRDCDIKWTSFFRTNASKSDFRGATLTTSLTQVDFTEANFEGVNFGGACLQKCNFRNANLKGVSGMTGGLWCNFRGADLRGANLSQVLPAGAERWNPDQPGNTTTPEFKGAKYDKNTLFPKGIDPVAMGAVFVEEESVTKP